jgi:hypothetical protein
VKHYDSYIGGVDLPAPSVVFVPRARAMIDRPREVFARKREYEMAGARLDELNDSNLSDDFIASVGLAQKDHLAQATEAAAKAAVEWADFPLEERLRIFDLFTKTLTAREEEFLDLLVAEGHPYRLAKWEMSGIYQGASKEQQSVYMQLMRQEYEADGRRYILWRKPDGVVCLSPPQNASGANASASPRSSRATPSWCNRPGPSRRARSSSTGRSSHPSSRRWGHRRARSTSCAPPPSGRSGRGCGILT